jgi:hypothetical protein
VAAAVRVVARADLRLGELLAEGGEGRVFQVEGGPDGLGTRHVYKELRTARPLSELEGLVSWPARLAASNPAYAFRLQAAAAWPERAVVGADPAFAVGSVLPKAPAPFWVRHRDGARRLATLSYLTTDPDRLAVAYGVALPEPGSAVRVALVYALARLLEAWQPGTRPTSAPDAWPSPQPCGRSTPRDRWPPAMVSVAHGDLSAKNVLWSVDPGPAVYILDCDDAVLVDEGLDHISGGVGGPLTGSPSSEANGGPDIPPAPARPRATTPNWDDPAVQPGNRPDLASDRYSLALVFLRVVGAAHFPLQGLQRSGDHVSVDLELPRRWRRLADMPRLWNLCERSLSVVAAKERPRPAEWVAELEGLLDALGHPELAAWVRAAQGDPASGGTEGGHGSAGPTAPARAPARARPAARAHAGAPVASPLATSEAAPAGVLDVEVRPVIQHRLPSTWQLVNPALDVLALAEGRVTGSQRGRQLVRQLLVKWARAHVLVVRLLLSPGRRGRGLRRLGGVALLDMVAGCVGLFLAGMVVSPWIGL